MTDSRHCPQRPGFVLVTTVDSSVTCLTYELSHICRTQVLIRLTRLRPMLWQRIYGALFDCEYQLNECHKFLMLGIPSWYLDNKEELTY